MSTSPPGPPSVVLTSPASPPPAPAPTVLIAWPTALVLCFIIAAVAVVCWHDHDFTKAIGQLLGAFALAQSPALIARFTRGAS